MEKMTLKAYAVKHKLSIFNVMKMVKSGQVKSEVFHENGREITYVLYNEDSEKEIEEQIVPIENKKDVDLERTIKNLQKEVELLRQEVENLKKKIF